MKAADYLLSALDLEKVRTLHDSKDDKNKSAIINC